MMWTEIGTVMLVWTLVSLVACVAVGRTIAIAEDRRADRCSGSSDIGFVPSQATREDALVRAAGDREVLEPLEV